MVIEIWSDVVCPFCYIGKRRLENALDHLGLHKQVDIQWKSFQLDPNQKTNPTRSAIQDLADKKGWTVDFAKNASAQVTAMAAAEGLMFDFEKAIPANTFNAHRLLQFAKNQNKGHLLKEILLKGYFTDGTNIDDATTLTTYGVEAGLDVDAVADVVNDASNYTHEVQRDIIEAQQMGIQGVPFFVFNRKYAISGAQQATVFIQTIEKAFAEWQSSQSTIDLETIEGPSCTPEQDCA